MEYQVRPLGKTCAATGAPLQPGEHVYSVLVDQHGALERVDFSAAAWDGPPQGTIGYWQCLVPTPEITHTSAVGTETLFQFFEQLIEEDASNNQQFLYVLTLFLLQRRRLRLDAARIDDDEVDWLQLTGSRGEGPFEIRDLKLPQQEISQLQQALSVRLATEWRAA